MVCCSTKKTANRSCTCLGKIYFVNSVSQTVEEQPRACFQKVYFLDTGVQATACICAGTNSLQTIYNKPRRKHICECKALNVRSDILPNKNVIYSCNKPSEDCNSIFGTQSCIDRNNSSQILKASKAASSQFSERCCRCKPDRKVRTKCLCKQTERLSSKKSDFQNRRWCAFHTVERKSDILPYNNVKYSCNFKKQSGDCNSIFGTQSCIDRNYTRRILKPSKAASSKFSEKSCRCKPDRKGRTKCLCNQPQRSFSKESDLQNRPWCAFHVVERKKKIIDLCKCYSHSNKYREGNTSLCNTVGKESEQLCRYANKPTKVDIPRAVHKTRKSRILVYIAEVCNREKCVYRARKGIDTNTLCNMKCEKSAIDQKLKSQQVKNRLKKCDKGFQCQCPQITPNKSNVTCSCNSLKKNNSSYNTPGSQYSDECSCGYYTGKTVKKNSGKGLKKRTFNNIEIGSSVNSYNYHSREGIKIGKRKKYLNKRKNKKEKVVDLNISPRNSCQCAKIIGKQKKKRNQQIIKTEKRKETRELRQEKREEKNKFEAI